MSALTSTSPPGPMLSALASSSSGLTTPAPTRFTHVPKISPSQLKHLQSQLPRGYALGLPTPVSVQPARSAAVDAEYESSDLSDSLMRSRDGSLRGLTPAEESDAREARRAQEREHSNGLIHKLEEVRARLNESQKGRSSLVDNGTIENSQLDEIRSAPRFTFEQLRDRGATIVAKRASPALDGEDVLGASAGPSVSSGNKDTIDERHLSTSRLTSYRTSRADDDALNASRYPPGPSREPSDLASSSHRGGQIRPSLLHQPSSRSSFEHVPLRASRISNESATTSRVNLPRPAEPHAHPHAQASTSSRSSTPTSRIIKPDRIRMQQSWEAGELDLPTSHMNVSKPFSERQINPEEDGQSSRPSSPGLSMHASDFSEEEKAPRKSLGELDRLTRREREEREAQQARPGRADSPDITPPSPTAGLARFGRSPLLDEATPTLRSDVRGHVPRSSVESSTSLTLSLNSLDDTSISPVGDGPSTSTPIKSRARPNLRNDEERLKRIMEKGPTRKTPSPIFSLRLGDKGDEREEAAYRNGRRNDEDEDGGETDDSLNGSARRRRALKMDEETLARRVGRVRSPLGDTAADEDVKGISPTNSWHLIGDERERRGSSDTTSRTSAHTSSARVGTNKDRTVTGLPPIADDTATPSALIKQSSSSSSTSTVTAMQPQADKNDKPRMARFLHRAEGDSSSDERVSKGKAPEQVATMTMANMATPPRPSTSRVAAFEIPPTPPDMPPLPSLSDVENSPERPIKRSVGSTVPEIRDLDEFTGPPTFIKQAESSLRELPVLENEEMAASFQGPLLRRNGQAGDEREWERVDTPWSSIIHVDKQDNPSPTRSETRSRMRNVSKGIEEVMRTPSKAKGSQPSSTDVSRRGSAEAPQAQTQNGLPDAMPSPIALDEISGLPLPTHASVSMVSGLASTGEVSSATVRPAILRLPSPVSRRATPAESSGLSRDPSISLHEARLAQNGSVESKLEGESRSVIVDKDVITRLLQGADDTQNIINSYEEREQLLRAQLAALGSAEEVAGRMKSSVVELANGHDGAMQPVSKPKSPWGVLKSILFMLVFVSILICTFEYGQRQAAYRRYLKPYPPALASLTSMYDETHLQRTFRYMSLRRPEIGYFPIEWFSWGIEALDYFVYGPFY